ncbi:unnamed protein product [Candida verbasci]|uniref:Uncharacterized protein n=1 Tax=Candida verbasci TaxID=1227364 RepID=A0A9W4XEL7_9ASCO|nr:unnamed protein product [Candida verbasci]
MYLPETPPSLSKSKANVLLNSIDQSPINIEYLSPESFSTPIKTKQKPLTNFDQYWDMISEGKSFIEPFQLFKILKLLDISNLRVKTKIVELTEGIYSKINKFQAREIFETALNSVFKIDSIDDTSIVLMDSKDFIKQSLVELDQIHHKLKNSFNLLESEINEIKDKNLKDLTELRNLCNANDNINDKIHIIRRDVNKLSGGFRSMKKEILNQVNASPKTYTNANLITSVLTEDEKILISKLHNESTSNISNILDNDDIELSSPTINHSNSLHRNLNYIVQDDIESKLSSTPGSKVVIRPIADAANEIINQMSNKTMESTNTDIFYYYQLYILFTIFYLIFKF